MQNNLTKEKYAQLVNLAGKVAITVSFLLIIIKMIAWVMTSSSSILAALTDSFMDLATSSINLFAIRFALQPADDSHRFGHGKAESLAGLAQAAFISGTSVLLMLNGISSLINKHIVTSSNIGIAVMLISVLFTIGLVIFQEYIVKRTGCVAIKADSVHYRSDILMNGAVLLSLILSLYGIFWADGVFAILVSFYILHGAWEIGTTSVNTLMDKQLSKVEEDQIVKIACKVQGVYGIHDLRTRQSGNTKFIQLHLELDDLLTLIDSHEIADEVEFALEQAFTHADIIIHLDPLSAIPVEKANGKLQFEINPIN